MLRVVERLVGLDRSGGRDELDLTRALIDIDTDRLVQLVGLVRLGLAGKTCVELAAAGALEGRFEYECCSFRLGHLTQVGVVNKLFVGQI